MNARIDVPAWMTGTTSTNDDVQTYIDYGWSLVPIPPSAKGPAHRGWNLQDAALKAAADLPVGFGIGLAHAYSGTMALDIDEWDTAVAELERHGIDLPALYDAQDAVIIDSGREGRGKLLYAMPFGLTLPSKKISRNGSTTYELRCATTNNLTVQDVLPPSIHPDTLQPYQWAGCGHWTRLPVIPMALLEHWQKLLSAEVIQGAAVPMEGKINWDDIESAVQSVPADCSREEWVTIGMVLHTAGVQDDNAEYAWGLWNSWSATSTTKYPGERDMAAQWRSFREDKATSARLGSLFHIAREHGWTKPMPDLSGFFGAVPVAGNEWPELQPLIAKIEAQVYPLDALPDAMRCAVQEVAGFVKAPIPLIASSALAALSLAIQAHVDVQRADKLHGPCGLFLLAIAESGERKTTCDGFFTKAIHDHEAATLEAAKPEILAHKSKHAAWTAQRAGLVEKIKTLSKGGNSTAAKALELHDLDDNEPRAPRVPRLIYGDTTPEELGFKPATVWPSGGVVSSEAGTVFGGHAMGKDSAMNNMAMLNQLWDGATLKVDRRTSASFTVQGARLTMALQVQDATLHAFFDATKGLARGTGFLARFLVSWPESTQGTRNFTEAPAHWPALVTFNNRLSAILNRSVAIDSDGGLPPAMLTLAPEAKAAWVRFHDAIEAELSPGGELAEVRDVASKCADNAARLAALFHVFAGNIGPIDLAAMDAGARIAAWHLHEAKRFLGELAMPAEVSNPGRLEAWMLDYCRREKTDSVPTREILRRGPGRLRDKAAFADAVKELTELGRARLVQDGKKRQVQINHLLLA